MSAPLPAPCPVPYPTAAPPPAPTAAPVSVPQAVTVSVSIDRPTTEVISRFVMTFLPVASTCASLREEIRKETRDGVSEPDGAVARVAPRGLRRRLRGLPRLFQLFAAVLRAFGHGLADALGRLCDAFPDLAVRNLLRAAFDLIGRVLYFRVVGSDGESGCEQRKREYEHDDQPESSH